MEKFRNPLFIAFITAAAISMLGAALGWFDVGNELVKNLANTELAKKQNLAIALSAASVGISILAIHTTKFKASFLATVVSIYQLIMVVNQKPDALVAQQLDLKILIGYWMTIIGTLGLIVVSGIIGIKGVQDKHSDAS